MALRPSIDRAVALFEEATSIAKRITQAVNDGVADMSAEDLKAAQERLNGAMERAQASHDALKDAIDQRLGGGQPTEGNS